MFSKKATKIDEIFTFDLTVTTYCQIGGEDFVNFWGLIRKRELYPSFLFQITYFLAINIAMLVNKMTGRQKIRSVARTTSQRKGWLISKRADATKPLIWINKI